MDRSHLIKPSSNPPPSEGPRQVEIRELDNPIIEIRGGVRTLVLALQIIEKKPSGDAPFENVAVQVKLDGEKISEIITDESGLLEKRIIIESGKSVFTITIPGTVAVYRKKIAEMMIVSIDESEVSPTENMLLSSLQRSKTFLDTFNANLVDIEDYFDIEQAHFKTLCLLFEYLINELASSRKKKVSFRDEFIPSHEIPIMDLLKIVERKALYVSTLCLCDLLYRISSNLNGGKSDPHEFQRFQNMKNELSTRISRSNNHIERKIAEFERRNS